MTSVGDCILKTAGHRRTAACRVRQDARPNGRIGSGKWKNRPAVAPTRIGASKQRTRGVQECCKKGVGDPKARPGIDNRGTKVSPERVYAMSARELAALLAASLPSWAAQHLSNSPAFEDLPLAAANDFVGIPDGLELRPRGDCLIASRAKTTYQ